MTKIEQVKKYLLEGIDKEKYLPGDKLPTEQELCEKFSVSRMTVRNALEDLKNKNIIYAIRGSGSYVNDVSTTLKNHKANINFLPLVANCIESYSRYLDVMKGVEDFAKTKNAFVALHLTNYESKLERDTLNNLIDKKVLYVIVYNPVNKAEFYYELMKQGMNFVFIDNVPQSLTSNLVTCDNMTGGYLMGKHLVKSGYRRIGMMRSKTELASGIEREKGFERALKNADIIMDNKYKYQFENNNPNDIMPELETALGRMLSLEFPPDAMFFINDVTAFSSYSILHKMKINVPNDLAICGYDNLSISSSNSVPITTIEQPFYQMGYKAAKLCYSIPNQDKGEFHTIYLPIKLIKRASTLKKV